MTAHPSNILRPETYRWCLRVRVTQPSPPALPLDSPRSPLPAPLDSKLSSTLPVRAYEYIYARTHTGNSSTALKDSKSLVSGRMNFNVRKVIDYSKQRYLSRPTQSITTFSMNSPSHLIGFESVPKSSSPPPPSIFCHLPPP